MRVQELTIDGVTYRLREPRLRDYLASRGCPPEEVSIAFLSGMVLDENDVPIGKEKVLELPLRVFGPLSEKVNEMMDVGADPLGTTNGSGSD